MRMAPCRYCCDRVLGCHGMCKDYIEWSQERKEEAKWEKDARDTIHLSDFTGTSPKPGTKRKTKHKKR